MKATDISGSGGGGGGAPEQHIPVEAENTLRSSAVYRVLDLISEGEIEGLVDGLKSVFVNGVPLQNSDNSYNFQGLAISVRKGVPSQPAMGDYPGEAAFGGFPEGIPTFVNINRPFTATFGGPDALLGPLQTEILGETNLDFLNLVVAVDCLYAAEPNGDVNPTTVTFAYELKANDTLAVTSGNNTFSGKCMSPYQRNIRVKVPQSNTGDYTLSLTRVTPDFPSTTPPGTTKYKGNLALIGFGLIRDRKLEYPDSAYIMGMADARLFGSNVPKRSYHIRGVKVSVPSGYTPPVKNTAGEWTAAVYPLIWDGGLTPLVYTSNPAWCLYDLLTNDRYGAGLPDIGGMLKTALYPISKYCDELIPDGFGGVEPRFTLNYAITAQTEAYNLINSLVSVFRGMCWWGPGSVMVSQDSPNAGGSSIPQAIVTPSNVIGGTFTYEGSAMKARHSVVMVSWNDPKDHGRPTIEYVEDRDSLLRYGLRVKDVAAVGCNSRGQAHRVGRWLLDSEKNETDVVKYKAGLDHAFITPGMLVGVVDPFYQTPAISSQAPYRDYSTLNRMGGRIISATASQIELDAPITLETGVSTYTISFLLAEETAESSPRVFDIAIDLAATGTGVPVTVIKPVMALALNEIPIPGSVWMISANNYDIYQTPRLFRVLSVVETDEGYEITALHHDPGKYARVEQGVNLLPQEWDTHPAPPEVSTPTNLVLTLGTKFINNQVQNVLRFSWSPSTDGRVVSTRVEWRVSTSAAEIDGDWSRQSLDGPAYVEVHALSLGYYEFRVRAETGLGLTSQWVLATFQLDADTLPAVTNLRLVNNEGVGRETFFVGPDIRVAWEDGNVTADNIALTKYVYLIEVTGGKLYETSSLDFTYTLFMNSSDNGGQPQRNVSFRVYKKRNDGLISTTSAYLAVQNLPPSMLGYSPLLTSGFKAIEIDWSNWATTDADLKEFWIYCDVANPPAMLVDTIGPTHTGWAIRDLDPTVAYYIKVLPVDMFGPGVASDTPPWASPNILSGTEVDVELRDSVIITDSLATNPATLAALYNRDKATLAMSYAAAGWVQFSFNIESYIDQVVVYSAAAGMKFFISYSTDGVTWTYLGGDALHALTATKGLTPAVSEAAAEASYWLTDYSVAQAFFPQRVTAKFCRLHILGGQTVGLSEVMFVREIIAEQIVTDSLSAISANLGTVETGVIISSNYSPGAAGMYLNVGAGTAEFNNIAFKFTNTTQRTAAQVALNVANGATNDSDIRHTNDTTKIDGGKIYAGSSVTTGNTAVVNGNMYSVLTGGDINFYDCYGGSFKQYKSLKKNQTGVCTTGVATNVGYFRAAPTIIISPKSLTSYNSAYVNQSQKFNLDATNIRKVGDDWWFDPTCQLVLSSGSIAGGTTGSVSGKGNPEAYNNTYPWDGPFYTAQVSNAVANVRSITVTVPVSIQNLIPTNMSINSYARLALQVYAGGAWYTGTYTDLGPFQTPSSTSINLSASAGADITTFCIIFYGRFPGYSWEADVYWPYNPDLSVSDSRVAAGISASTLYLASTTISVSGTANYMAIG